MDKRRGRSSHVKLELTQLFVCQGLLRLGTSVLLAETVALRKTIISWIFDAERSDKAHLTVVT